MSTKTEPDGMLDEYARAIYMADHAETETKREQWAERASLLQDELTKREEQRARRRARERGAELVARDDAARAAREAEKAERAARAAAAAEATEAAAEAQSALSAADDAVVRLISAANRVAPGPGARLARPRGGRLVRGSAC